MIQLSGILGESLGGACTLRGYAKYDEIVNLSYPHDGYQRPSEDDHVNEISAFITSGANSFSPEVVLAYTAKYDYYKEGASSDVDALADIRSGKGFTSNVDGISFKKMRLVENGVLYSLSIPEKTYGSSEEKPFRRVDGNHRLRAIEKLMSNGQMRSTYLIPFCIILFPDNSQLKDEKVIFHNINSKAVPIRSEQLLEGIVINKNDGLSFSDQELTEKFGPEYMLARTLLYTKPLAIRKLKSIPWVKMNLITTIIDLINYVKQKCGPIDTVEKNEAFGNALSNALSAGKAISPEETHIASGLFFLLVALNYKIELTTPAEDCITYKSRLLSWANKYQITDAQINTEENAANNADCIDAIYKRYAVSAEQRIFMSRCFSSEYNESENAIRRAIKEINEEKKSGLTLIRVDEHHEGATGQISDRIFREIEKAGLIIADLSSGKLNIPHEIGYAMGLKRDLILIHNGTPEDAEKNIPSNIRMFEQIRFNGDYQTLQTEIKRRLIDYYKL